MTEIKDFFMAVYLGAVGEEMTDVQVQPEEIFCFADSPPCRSALGLTAPMPPW